MGRPYRGRSQRPLSPADLEPLYAVGLQATDVEHAIAVCCSFSIMNRLVDAFGADLQGDDIEKVANLLDGIGRVAKSTRRANKRDDAIAPALPPWVTTMKAAVYGDEGDAPPAWRIAAEHRVAGACGASRREVEPLPHEVERFVHKVGQDVWALTDDDFTRLHEHGLSALGIFELVYCAAVGAGLGRLEVGFALVAVR